MSSRRADGDYLMVSTEYSVSVDGERLSEQANAGLALGQQAVSQSCLGLFAGHEAPSL